MNSNNKFGKCCGCPALMSDGRLFTNYIDNKFLNEKAMKVNNHTDHNQYRSSLQENGTKIMLQERVYNEKNKKCRK